MLHDEELIDPTQRIVDHIIGSPKFLSWFDEWNANGRSFSRPRKGKPFMIGLDEAHILSLGIPLTKGEFDIETLLKFISMFLRGVVKPKKLFNK